MSSSTPKPPVAQSSGRSGASSSYGEERRRRERLRLHGAAVSCPTVDFTVLDLSPSGMSIETSEELRVGDLYELRIRHKRSIIAAEGTVKWCRLHEVANAVDRARIEYVYRAGLELEMKGTSDTVVGEGVLVGGDGTGEVGAMSSEKLEAAAEIIDRDLLRVVYQPIFDLKAGAVFAYEALARCPSEHFSSLPDLFAAAARIDRVGELGRLHRVQAIASAPAKPLFLNVSPHEFGHGWLIRPDDPMFRHPQKVYLEVTESVPIDRFEQCRAVLAELRKKGLSVAIDDLGAGFSNLKYLADLAPEFVKIDRTLIAGITSDPRSYALLEAVVAMCKRLGTRVIAEGIETRAELVAVDQAGVTLCQGYLLGRPAFPAPEDSWPAFL